MPLKASYSKKEDIPAGLEAFYKEAGGKWIVDVDGMKTQADFDSYAEALKKRFTDAAADLNSKNNTGLNRDDVNEIMEAAIKKFAAAKPPGSPGDNGGKDQNGELAEKLHELDRKVAALTETNVKLQTERDAAVGTSKQTTIRNELSTAAQAAKAIPEGIKNLVTLVEPNFEVAQDGSVVTKLDAGNGVSPNQKPTDFFAAAARDQGYRMFWPESKGAGAENGEHSNGGGGGDLTAANPWSKAGWNVTKQSQQYNTDKIEAGRLMESAGVKLGAIAPVR